MKKALIYGLGPTGIQSLWHLSLEYEILGFVVSDERRIQTGGGGGWGKMAKKIQNICQRKKQI